MMEGWMRDWSVRACGASMIGDGNDVAEDIGRWIGTAVIDERDGVLEDGGSEVPSIDAGVVSKPCTEGEVLDPWDRA